MITNLIRDIEKQEKEFGEMLPNKISNEKIKKFKSWMVTKFGESTVADQYINSFLVNTNGLNFNGLFLYGFDTEEDIDLVENNEIWHENEWNKKYLFFGEDSISWYVWDSEINIFQILDKPGGEVEEEFNNISELIEKAMQISLL
ncbi:TPA: YrhA family protein [Listeria monocytogenes]